MQWSYSRWGGKHWFVRGLTNHCETKAEHSQTGTWAFSWPLYWQKSTYITRHWTSFTQCANLKQVQKALTDRVEDKEGHLTGFWCLGKVTVWWLHREHGEYGELGKLCWKMLQYDIFLRVCPVYAAAEDVYCHSHWFKRAQNFSIIWRVNSISHVCIY